MPGVLTAIRVVVMVLSGLWVVVTSMLWWGALSSPSTTALGPIMNSFALGMTAGDWVGNLLVPVAGMVLTATMARGHAIDRLLFTALSLIWIWWLVRHVVILQQVQNFVVAVVVLMLILAWSPPMNKWISAVARWETTVASPPEGGWLERGQVQPWQVGQRRL